MSTSKKDDEKQKPKKTDSNPSSKQRDPSSDKKDDGKIKKQASKPGFSVLSTLAKFMSGAKSETTQPLQQLTEVKMEKSESSPQVPKYKEASSQASDLSFRRSSTLNAISKALEALKGVRRRIAVLAKNKQSDEADILHPVETQTSSSLLSLGSEFVSHDPHLLLKNKSFDQQHNNTSFKYHSDNMSTLNPRSINQESKSPQAHHSHVSFKGNSDYYEVNISNTPPKTNLTLNESVESLSNNSFDSGEVLFHSTPKSGKGKSDGRELPPLHLSTKHANIQTEPETEMRGTQTSLLQTINENQPSSVHHSESETSLVRRILHDREKCPKCDLFELMFLHGGEKVLNDKEMLSMFKGHMNSHLLKAQEDLNKLYKWPRRIAEIEDVSEQEKITDREKSGDMAVRTDVYPGSNVDENKYRGDEVTSMATKNKIGTPPQKMQVNADNDETKEDDSENNLNATNLSETKGANRSTYRRRHSHDHSYSYEQILQDHLASRKGDCSEEVIIRRKHCQNHNDENNRPDFLNGYDDGYYYSENVGQVRGKSHRRFNSGFETDTTTTSNRYGRCSCERLKYAPVNNLINYGCGNMCGGYDACNCKCAGANISSRYCNNPRQLDDSRGMESQLKWFLKGMLATLKGHHDVKSNESNKAKSGSVSSSPYEGKHERIGNDFHEVNAVENIPEGFKSTAGKQPSDPPEIVGETSTDANTNGRHREGSILSDMAFFMVKENVKKRSNSDEEKSGGGPGPDSSSQDKQDVKNKLDQTGDFYCSLPSTNKSKLNSSSQDGKECKNGTLHRNFNLEDPNVQELVQDILSVFCTKFPAKEGNSGKNGYEDPSAELISCSDANSDEIVQQVCTKLKETITTARTSTEMPDSAPEDGSTREGASNKQREPCSYFYPMCDDDNNSNTWSGFYCCRYLNQAEPCCGNEGQNSIDNFCPLPLQEAFERYHTTCYRRVKTRQACISNCRRERESVQRQRRKSPVKAIAHCSRPSTTAAAQFRENFFCGCNINSATTRCHQDACEGFTYEVPKSQVYWHCY